MTTATNKNTGTITRNQRSIKVNLISAFTIVERRRRGAKFTYINSASKIYKNNSDALNSTLLGSTLNPNKESGRMNENGRLLTKRSSSLRSVGDTSVRNTRHKSNLSNHSASTNSFRKRTDSSRD